MQFIIGSAYSQFFKYNLVRYFLSGLILLWEPNGSHWHVRWQDLIFLERSLVRSAIQHNVHFSIKKPDMSPNEKKKIAIFLDRWKALVPSI